ncbi:MAG: Rpn family recombination-promoting nuclease/putative transposase [Planctomycetes bacterium]|nr:Rpn family recombination-promoting nuclease/putative transposase [Planctomycetota bacterium]
MTHNPHDALFKASLTPEAARSLCRAVLPAEIAQAFEDVEITRAPGEFIEEALRDRSSDVLYRAMLGEEETLIYVLFEHQSTVDRLMAFRVLRYMVRIWSQWLDDQETRPEKLPPILPIVVYHGERPWNAAQAFEDLVDLPPPLAAAKHLVPSFRFVLDDLSQCSDEELRAREAPAFAAVTWIFFRHAYDANRGIEVWQDCADLIGELATDLPKQHESLLQLVRYSLLQSLGSAEELREELRRVGGQEAEELAVTAGEQLLEQGREQGRREGEVKGVLKGERRLLSRILARLGTITPTIDARIQAAEADDLEKWAELALSANTIEDVFED